MTLPPLTLRNKLLAFAALSVLVPGLVIGVLAERSGRDSLEQLIGGRLAREAGHTAERLASVLRGERDLLRSFGHQDVMREIRVGDIDKRISRSLRTLRDGSPGRLDYWVADPGGRIVAASNPAWIGDPPPALETLADFQVHSLRVRDPAEPHALLPARRVLVLRATVVDPDVPDADLGSLFGLLDWEVVTAATEDVRRDLEAQGITARVWIVAPNCALLRAADTPGAVPTPHRLDAVVAGRQASPDWVVDARLDAIVGGASLGGDLPAWRVLVAQRLSDALAPAHRLRNRIAGTMSLALASALLIAALAARRVSSPLSELTRAIRGLSRGDPAIVRVPVRTQDEIGTLAAAFNHMASELDRVQRNLVEAEKFAFVGELASGVAHEVRTSLGVLRSSAQILERTLSGHIAAEVRELAEMIRAEADRLAGVVNDLLSLDRPRSLRLEPVRLAAVLGRAADFVEPQAEEKGVVVRRHLGGRDPAVLCDEEAMQQVALNLLVNAIEALGPGGRIDLEVLEPHEGHGGFAVRDDGSGVPEALREKIFQPFVTAKDGGVGLGLTFVKRVVHEHHGRILLEPGTRAGACFRVEIPLAPADAEETP